MLYLRAPLNIITPASTIAAQLNIGTGVALAYKMQHKPNVVVALSGEGSTSLGFWHEAVNFAGVHKLPIIFVIENNGQAVADDVASATLSDSFVLVPDTRRRLAPG